jgi:hypothetical protein
MLLIRFWSWPISMYSLFKTPWSWPISMYNISALFRVDFVTPIPDKERLQYSTPSAAKMTDYSGPLTTPVNYQE